MGHENPRSRTPLWGMGCLTQVLGQGTHKETYSMSRKESLSSKKYLLFLSLFCYEIASWLLDSMDSVNVSFFVATAILLFFAIFVTALRCFVRIRYLKAFGLDDYLIVAATVSLCFHFSCWVAMADFLGVLYSYRGVRGSCFDYSTW